MIHLHLAPGGTARKALSELIPGFVAASVREHLPRVAEIPAKADFVVHVGSGAETRSHRMFALNRGAMIVHLPEGYEWLQRRITDAVELGEDLVVLDAGLVTMKVAA